MIFNNWHLWRGNGFMLSNENTKELRQFNNVDEAINYLYLNGEKEAARYFNKNKGLL
jgi:hypothetical protein